MIEITESQKETRKAVMIVSYDGFMLIESKYGSIHEDTWVVDSGASTNTI
jgi:hypothetical protein